MLHPLRASSLQRPVYNVLRNGQAKMATAAAPEKKVAALDDVLSRLPELPPRFLDLKKELWKDSFVQSWKEVIGELEITTNEIIEKGSSVVPRVPYSELEAGLSPRRIAELKRAGCMVITGAVPVEEALKWKTDILDYARANKDHVKGFPAGDIQMFDLYNTKSQTRARTHPNIVNTQRVLLSLWEQNGASKEVDLTTPISYFDRIRVRPAGDKLFSLGPHIDGGSIERWEDPAFRSCWSSILAGKWREHNPFIANPRIHATPDMYAAPNQCSIFRPWQGWTSMSSTGPGEGTLKVLPMLNLLTTYLILRPFFKPKARSSDGSVSLAAEDWEPDLTTSSFPGSGIGVAQGLSDLTHPHLRLNQTMVPIGRVEPGDQVYWHCDMVHSVEAENGGKGDSSVLYIPAVPLTVKNAKYLKAQRERFLSGHPAPDFPAGPGDSGCQGRATVEDLPTIEAKRMLGFAPFDLANKGDSFDTQVHQILA